ncbi:MAG: hypothetical protein LDL56_00610 [Armatimonadetes bacterium]|nr:hypothetical protein [Armatimonadota bacterium]
MSKTPDSVLAPAAPTLSVRDVLPIVIDYIDRMFPERGYRPGARLEDLAYEGGKRAVVEHLRTLLDDDDVPTS